MEQTTSMTSGKPLKLILQLGLPLLAGNILQQLYNFVDTVVVGRGIGTAALAAVGLTGAIHFLVLGFISGLAQGVSILAAQFFGAGDYSSLRKSVTMSALVNYASGIVITALSLWQASWILEIMQTPADILPYSLTYLQIIFGGILISLTYNFLSGILRAFGDARNPLIAMIIAFFVNTILDIWFVMGLQMGVAGAAWATVIAQGISALYCWICCRKISVLRMERKDWKWDGAMAWKSFILSFPVAIMNSITAVGVMFLQAAINTFGAVYIAGYSTASKIIVLTEQISSTFGFASGTFVGQNMGAGLTERIQEGVRVIQKAVAGMNLGTCLVLIVIGRPLLALMLSADEPEVIDIAYQCVVFLSVFLVALGILWIFRCALQSMSDTFFPMLSGILEFVSRVVCIMILPHFFGFYGVLMSEVSAWIAAALMLGIVYTWRMKKERKKQTLAGELAL